MRYRQNGREQMATAGREIVLAGGAINSPQLLQLSGVGSAEHLRAHGIEVVHELKGVGHNLQDHFQARSVYRCTKPITLNDRVRSPFQKALMGLEWLLYRTGPLTVGAGQGAIFARTRPELATPDIQFHIVLFSADRPGRRCTVSRASPPRSASCGRRAAAGPAALRRPERQTAHHRQLPRHRDRPALHRRRPAARPPP